MQVFLVYFFYFMNFWQRWTFFLASLSQKRLAGQVPSTALLQAWNEYFQIIKSFDINIAVIWFEIWPVDVERILREPSKDDQWSWSPGEKQQKWKRFVWKQSFTAEGNFWFQCRQPCHMPHDIGDLESLTSCNQVHLPNSVHQRKVTKWKWYPCNGCLCSFSLDHSLGIKH